MLGFIIGTACLIGLIKVARGGCGGGYFGGWGGWGGRGFRGGWGGGRRWEERRVGKEWPSKGEWRGGCWQ
jgi:hypothetical protein